MHLCKAFNAEYALIYLRGQGDAEFWPKKYPIKGSRAGHLIVIKPRAVRVGVWENEAKGGFMGLV